MGPPRLESTTGERIEISSKKAVALLALLGTADRLERSRVWLQQVLWGSRGQKQAQSSLRRELSTLRTLLTRHDLDILEVGQRTVSLKGDMVTIDFLENPTHHLQRQFCEGVDLAGEEGFEDWLRAMRSELEERSAVGPRDPERSAPPAFPAGSLKAQIAVMPTSMSRTSHEDLWIADRTYHSLVDLLTRVRWLPNVSAHDIPPDRDGNLSSETVSERLGVRYLARSEVHETDGGADINFALLEMPGRIIRWTETRRIDKADNASFSAELARAVNCLGATFDTCEQRHFRLDEPHETLDLAERNWRIRFHIDQFTRESFTLATSLIDTAMERYPENGELLMLRANLELWQHWIDRSNTSSSSRLAPLIRAAMRADPTDARGHLFHGILDTWHYRGDTAMQHLRRACELDPSLAQGFVHLGAAHYLAGDPEGAVAPLQHALFLAPLDAKRFFALGELATVYWMLKRYDEAIEIAQKIRTTHPGYVLAHVIETASHSCAGRLKEARRARSEMLEGNPARYKAMLDWIPFQDTSWVTKLRRAVDFDGGDRPLLYSVGKS